MKKLATLICTLAIVVALMPAPKAEAATNYSYYGNEQQLITYLIALIKQLQAEIEHRNDNNHMIYQFGYGGSLGHDNVVVGKPRPGGGSSSNDDDEPEVTTLSARDIEDDGAEIRGEVDMNDFENGEVFFVYGEDEDQVSDIEDDYESYNDIDEDGDDLNKLKVDNDLDDDDTYESTISGFDDNADIFYQICVGYEDEDDDEVITCGGVEDFETGDDNNNDDDDDSNDDEPEATTDEADEVSDDSAELNGSVDMNDFENGVVFFVYGEDEGMVGDVEDDFDTYDDVDEDGDDLQKVKVDSDLDDNSTYWFDIVNLNDDTDHFFQICVEWEDGDESLTCGGVEEFTTDN